MSENDDLIERLEQLASEFGGPQDRYCVVYGEAATALTAAEARIKMLEEALDLYRAAVRIDVQMDGPKFMGSNASALKRAWEADRALSQEPAHD